MAKVTIDPRFAAPEVIGVEYLDNGTLVFADDNPDMIVASPSDFVTVESAPEQTGQLEAPSLINPPESITLLQELVRFSPDGSAVVDVVIEISDVPGAAEYESREATV